MPPVIRQLGKNPGFTVIAILTLALGIGATTAIFSVVHGVLLKPLPYRGADRLVRVHETLPARGLGKIPVAVPNYLDWRAQNTVFTDLAAHAWAELNLTGLGEPRRLRGARVTASLFNVLQVKPALGRFLQPADEARAGERVVVISHDFWQRELGGDPAALGRSLQLDGEPHTIVGVAPPGLAYPGRRLEVWLPPFWSDEERTQRGNHRWGVVGRLKPGVPLARADAEIRGIASRIARSDAEARDFNAAVISLQDDLVGDLRTPLLILLGAVACVLAIACANVANLLLARASAREKEFAVRAALGAGRGILIRQLLAESLVLAGSGGLLGVLLAVWGVAALVRLSGPGLPRASEVGLHLPVLVFATVMTLLTGILFGLVPALRAAGTSASEALKDGGRSGSEGWRRNRYRAGLVVAEIALSLVLLAGAGLLLRSFQRLQDTPPGFRTAGITTADLLLPGRKYPSEGLQAAAFQRIVENLRAVSGIEEASAVFGLPLGTQRSKLRFEIEGRPPMTGAEAPDASYRQVGDRYFRTLEIPLVTGRDFQSTDTTNQAPVAIVNEAFVRRYFPELPRGTVPSSRINLDGGSNSWVRIVGVVGDARSEALHEAPVPELFVPLTQRCWGFASLVVRSSLDPASVGTALRGAVAAVDSELPLNSVRPLQAYVDDTLANRRLQALLLGAFALLALVLAASGIYGVMAYTVSRRVQEIGIRMALGARFQDVVSLVLRQGLTLTGWGVGLGLAGGLFAARALASLLYEIQPHDPPTFGGVTVILALVALLACWVPARRAARVDPMRALRNE